MNKITLDQLKEHNACVEQLHLFKELFGKEVEVTVGKCVEYYDKFDWAWAALHLLSDELYEKYFKIKRLAREEYLKIQQPAWEEYKKKTAQAFGECYLKQ